MREPIGRRNFPINGKAIASVIRRSPTQDLTANGITARFDSLIVSDGEGFSQEGCYNADGALVAPCVKRVGDHYEPVCGPKDGFVGWMCGGNGVIVDGKRFKCHDRQESRSEHLSHD